MSMFESLLGGFSGAGSAGAGAGGGFFDWLKNNASVNVRGKGFSAQFGKNRQQREQEEMMDFIKQLFPTLQPNKPQNESRSSIIKSPGNSAIESSIVTDPTFDPLSQLGGFNLSQPARTPNPGGGNPLSFLRPGFNPNFGMR